MKTELYNESTHCNEQSVMNTNRQSQSSFGVIKQIYKFKQMQKPQLTQDQREKVQRRITLDGQALEKFKNRQEMNDFYCDYNVNPFFPASTIQKQNLLQEIKRNDQNVKQVVQFLDPTHRNYQKQAQIETSFKNITAMKGDFQLKSQKNINGLKNQFFDKTIKRRNKKQQIKDPHHKLTLIQRIESNDIQDLEIEDIASVKQNNIFMENGFKPNIFQILINDKVVNSIDYLKKHKLSMNSILEKNFKFKISTYRNLSNLGRRIITDSYDGKDKITDYLNTDQMVMYPSELRFVDLLNMASNRVSPEYAYHQENKTQMTDDDESQEDTNRKIIYEKYEKNKKNNYIGKDEQIQQAIIYKKADKIQKQIDASHLYNHQKSEIFEEEQKLTKLFANGIKDGNTISHLQDKLRDKIRNIICCNKNDVRLQQTIGQKKRNSNKVQSIRLKAYQQLLAQKANFQNIKKNFNLNIQKNRGKFSKC